jgi:polyvinyl alcohol dehydrogenase (cytochrome)
MGRHWSSLATAYGIVQTLSDNAGKELWQRRVGEGGPLGAIMYDAAADARAVYVSVADRDSKPPFAPGRLTALRLSDGKRLWHALAPEPRCSWGTHDCSGAQPGAVTAIPKVIFSGSLDGHMRAFSADRGTLIWDVDTAQNYRAVNGVKITARKVVAARDSRVIYPAPAPGRGLICHVRVRHFLPSKRTRELRKNRTY